MVSSKKTAVVSVELNRSEERFRQNTAACVSLSKSTISKTNTGKTRPHCFTPVSGGGGDLVASVFRVKQFFLKNFSSPCRTRRNGGGGYLMKAEPRVNRTFEPFQNPKPEGPGRRKPPEKAARPPSCVFNDSTEARKLTEQTPKRKAETPPSQADPEGTLRPPRAASSPSPSEAAIYEPPTPTATRFLRSLKNSDTTTVNQKQPAACQPAAI